MKEESWIAYLKNKFSSHAPSLQVGIGDDAAVFSSSLLPSANQSILTSDMLLDGVHFDTKATSAYRIGRKALAVNLSDCAAMAAKPRLAVVSLALPRGLSSEFLHDFYSGLQDLAERFEVSICGGDTNSWSGPFAVSLTLLGEVAPKGAVLRSGAKLGDAILVTGDLGGSLSGKHLDFTPRVLEATFLHQHYPLHALMDLSDGLASDLARLCKASGVGAVLDAAAIPLAAPVREFSDALQRALCDGEDFELLFTLPQEDALHLMLEQPLAHCKLSCIGRIVAEPGLFWQKEAGKREVIAWQGYEHGW